MEMMIENKIGREEHQERVVITVVVKEKRRKNKE